MKRLLTILFCFCVSFGTMAQGAGVMERACFCGLTPTPSQIKSLFGIPTPTGAKKAFETISSRHYSWVWDDVAMTDGEWAWDNAGIEWVWRLGGNNSFPTSNGQLLSNKIGSLDANIPLLFHSHNYYAGGLSQKNTSFGYRSKEWAYPVSSLQTANTAIGEGAGTNFGMGIGNTFLGKYSGYSVSSGHNNTIIGKDVSGNIISAKAGLTVLGANQDYKNAADNSILLGTGDGTTQLNVIGGRVSIGNGVAAGNSAKLEVYPTGSDFAIKLVDGNEGLGKVLTSDANGNGYWDNPLVVGTQLLISDIISTTVSNVSIPNGVIITKPITIKAGTYYCVFSAENVEITYAIGSNSTAFQPLTTLTNIVVSGGTFQTIKFKISTTISGVANRQYFINLSK